MGDSTRRTPPPPSPGRLPAGGDSLSGHFVAIGPAPPSPTSTRDRQVIPSFSMISSLSCFALAPPVWTPISAKGLFVRQFQLLLAQIKSLHTDVEEESQRR